MTTAWSHAEIETLKAALTVGATNTEISHKLFNGHGTRRSISAVAGMVSRLKKPAHKGPNARDEGFKIVRQPHTRRAAQAKKRAKAAKQPPKPRVDSPYAPPVPVRVPPGGRDFDAASLRLPLLDLGLGCKWPVTDTAPGETHLFCGLPRGDGPYCQHHHTRSRAS